MLGLAGVCKRSLAGTALFGSEASIEMWNWPVFEGCKRFSELVDSPYHGFNFCCGTASEGLDDPASELCPIVKYFADKKKIFHIRQFHFCGCATPP